MAKVALEGSSDTPTAKRYARMFSEAENRPMQDGSWVPRSTEFNVYIFTVAKRDFKTTHALIPLVEIPACGPNERYKKVRFIPHPFPQKVEDVFNTGREPYDYHSAERIAQDICDPTNPTLNQGISDYGKIDPYWFAQDGTNFSKHGVFWSRNETPTEDELKNAETKRDNYYRFLISEADRFYAADPNTAITKITPDHRMALNFFGEERPWHKKFTPMQACPNCAQQIPQGVAFHRDIDGDICVIDWKRTVAAGKRKKEDVPNEFRWWDETATKK